MYMANHNLNVDISFAGISLLVPNTLILDETNAAADVYGSLKRNTLGCTGMWNRPPNFLLVDYHNVGDFNGSVFQVAVDANGVGYDRASCCGTQAKSAAVGWRANSWGTAGTIAFFLVAAAVVLSI